MPFEKQFDPDSALDKAMDAFWCRGYEATSMQDLVEATGLNRGSLYNTFGDKRSLFLAALGRYDARHRADLLADLEARFPPREAIRQVFLAFLEQNRGGGGNNGCLINNTAIELAAHDPEIRGIVARAQTEMERFFARMLRKGREDGDIPRHVAPTDTARGLLASLLGLMVLIRSRPDPDLLSGIVADAVRRLD